MALVNKCHFNYSKFLGRLANKANNMTLLSDKLVANPRLFACTTNRLQKSHSTNIDPLPCSAVALERIAEVSKVEEVVAEIVVSTSYRFLTIATS